MYKIYKEDYASEVLQNTVHNLKTIIVFCYLNNTIHRL